MELTDKGAADLASKDKPKTKSGVSSIADIGDDMKKASDALAPKLTPLIPMRHKGGPIPKDGPYNLKAGEHVLTAKEADKARKHALMASGMKSLAKPAPKKGK